MTNETLESLFLEFARAKESTDGSDAHITGAIQLAVESDNPLWYAGCFAVPYCTPTSHIVFKTWGPHQVLHHTEKVLEWALANWEYLPMGSARKTNRMGPHKFVETLAGYAQWLEDGGHKELDKDSFDKAFKQLTATVPNFGRYTGLKLYEFLRRVGLDIPEVSDIRPRGGRTPRRTLKAIYGHDNHVDDQEHADEANRLAGALRDRTGTSWFNIESQLCLFHSTTSGKYYAGYSGDRELAKLYASQSAFSDEVGAIFDVRKRLFGDEHLGEVSGWSGVRKELLAVTKNDGYVWTDDVYHYPTLARRDPPLPMARMRSAGE